MPTCMQRRKSTDPLLEIQQPAKKQRGPSAIAEEGAEKGEEPAPSPPVAETKGSEGAVPAPPTQGEASSKAGVEALEGQIKEQGDKVRQLKTSGAEKVGGPMACGKMMDDHMIRCRHIWTSSQTHEIHNDLDAKCLIALL